MDDLAVRVTRLERSARSWRRATIGLGAIFVIAALAAAARRDDGPIRSTSFELVDSHGVKRGAFRCNKEDHPYLILLDKDSRSRASLLLQDDDRPLLTIYDPVKDKMALRFGIGFTDGDPQIDFFDANGDITKSVP